MCGALRDLAQFVRFKKRERGVFILVNLQVCSVT